MVITGRDPGDEQPWRPGEMPARRIYTPTPKLPDALPHALTATECWRLMMRREQMLAEEWDLDPNRMAFFRYLVRTGRLTDA